MNLMRTVEDVERSLSEPLDLDREAWRARHVRFARDPRTGLSVPLRVIAGGSPASETGTQCELLYISPTPGTSKNSFTAEAIINDTAGMGAPPQLRPWYFQPSGIGPRVLRVVCRGLVSSTGTPTFILGFRLGTSQSIAGPAIAASGAMATVNNAALAIWEAEFDMHVRTLGAAGANTLVNSYGMVISPGFNPAIASLFGNPATVDASILNYLTVSAICSANSASNAIQIGQLLVYRQN